MRTGGVISCAEAVCACIDGNSSETVTSERIADCCYSLDAPQTMLAGSMRNVTGRPGPRYFERE